VTSTKELLPRKEGHPDGATSPYLFPTSSARQSRPRFVFDTAPAARGTQRGVEWTFLRTGWAICRNPHVPTFRGLAIGRLAVASFHPVLLRFYSDPGDGQEDAAFSCAAQYGARCRRRRTVVRKVLFHYS
jgi:hypothetical protein